MLSNMSLTIFVATFLAMVVIVLVPIFLYMVARKGADTKKKKIMRIIFIVVIPELIVICASIAIVGKLVVDLVMKNYM